MEAGKLSDPQKLMRAVELELEAIRIYLEMADNTKNPELIKLFHHVALEEKVHVGEFMAALLKIDRKFAEAFLEGMREKNEKQAEFIADEISPEDVQEAEEDLIGEE